MQIIPTSVVLDQFGFVQILDMHSPPSKIPHDCAETCTSQIPQQCANDCAETGDGSLDGDGGAAASLGLNSEVEDGKGYT